jgi:ATP-dependent RNA helicase DDX47/RRP3
MSKSYAYAHDYLLFRVGRTARAGRNGRAITFVTQYDVELYQRIEHFLGQKMELLPTEEQNVMLLMERVSEAQRIAAMELREKDDADKGARTPLLLIMTRVCM